MASLVCAAPAAGGALARARRDTLPLSSACACARSAPAAARHCSASSSQGSSSLISRAPRPVVAARAAKSQAPPDMTVDQIMVKTPILFTDTMPIKDAVKIMLDKNFSGAPVVDKNGKLVGILSESDVIWKGAGAPLDHYIIPPTYISILDSVIQLRDQKQTDDEVHKILSRTVGEAMTKDVITVASGTSLASACSLMLAKKVNRLPVVEGGKVVGVVTRHDLLRGIYNEKDFM